MAGPLGWYYNSNTGAVVLAPKDVFFPEHLGLGWHGPFDSYQAAIDYYNNGKAANPDWKPPTSDPGQAIQNAGSSAVQTTEKLAGLDLGGWFIRVGEILLGLILIGVGVAKLTGAGNLISQIAKVPI